ncbi:hypothetical protein ABVT39_018782 [Epinephelus coioides]
MPSTVSLSHLYATQRSTQGRTSPDTKMFDPHIRPPCQLHHNTPSDYLTPPIDKVLESVFLLAFFGFLRCSEFTTSSLNLQPSRHATLSDMTIQSTGPPQLIYLF